MEKIYTRIRNIKMGKLSLNFSNCSIVTVLILIKTFLSLWTDLQNILQASTIALSTLVFVLLTVIGVFVWRLRRTVPNNKASTADKDVTDNVGQARSSRAQHVSEPGVYMELDPRPSEGQSRAPSEYQTLQGRHMTSECYNVGFKEGNRNKEDEES